MSLGSRHCLPCLCCFPQAQRRLLCYRYYLNIIIQKRVECYKLGGTYRPRCLKPGIILTYKNLKTNQWNFDKDNARNVRLVKDCRYDFTVQLNVDQISKDASDFLRSIDKQHLRAQYRDTVHALREELMLQSLNRIRN